MQLRPVLVGALLCGLAAAPIGAPAGVTKPTLPAFTPPLALAGGGAEPSIRVAPDGRSAAYVSAPAALGSNFWRVDQVRNPDGTYSMVGSKPQQPDLGTGGGDSEISIGTGRPFGLQASTTAATMSAAYSLML